jgi:hypothetical protein
MSNPTSNFGWQMPTNTDLVSQLPADFEVFGQAVDTSLADLKGGTTGQVLKKNTNADMDFVWAADSAGMTNPMTTTGDTIYSSSGSTPARLGIGTTGQILTVSGGVPVWAAPAGGGKVLQVLSYVDSSTNSTTSTSFADTDLTLNITPSATSSKVLVMITTRYRTNNSSNALANFRLVRNSTGLTSEGYVGNSNNAVQTYGRFALTYLDSPSTTSATTYKLQFASEIGGATVSAGGEDSCTITLMEIGA